MEQAFRYRAFISYSHADEAWAKWLHRALETYRVPRRLRRGEGRATPKRLMPVFRDRDELPSAAELGSVIQQALRQSEALIVVCSPRAAGSRWVNEEIRYFKSLGRGGQVLALIVDGEPHSAEAAQECFPQALKLSVLADGSLGGAAVEPIAADARQGRDGRREALLKLAAGLLNVGFDELRQRERQRQFWQRVQQAVTALALLVLLVGSWQWFERYKAARALEQKVERFYEKGRLALLDQRAAPAAVYLAEAYRLGRDTPALRFMLARALESVTALHPLTGSAGGRIQRPAYRPDDLEFVTPVVGDTESHAVIWDAVAGRERVQLQGLPRVPQISRYLPDGARVLISGYAESSVYGQHGASTGVWDAATGSRLLTLPGHSGHFGNPFTADGRQLLTTEEPGFTGVHLRDIASGAVLRSLPHPAQASAASFSPDGRWVFSGDALGRVRQWDAATGRLLATLPGQTATGIVGVLVTPDGQRVIGVSRKGDVRVWGLPDGELQLAFAADKSFVADVRFDATGARLLTIGRQGYKVWDLARGTLLFAHDIELDWTATGDLDASGHRVVIASGDGLEAELWDVQSRRRVSLMQFGAAQMVASLFSHQGKSLLLGSYAGRVASVQPLPGVALEVAQPPGVYSASFSPDGQHMASGGWDQQLRLWDSRSGAALAVGSGHQQLVDQTLYSADGQRITTASQDGSLRLWRASDASLLAMSVAHPAVGIDRLIASSDGSRLLSIPYGGQSQDLSIKLWDAADLHRLQTFLHPAFVWDASFSADGRQVATACEDGHLRVWNALSGELRFDVALVPHTLLRVGYTPQDYSLWAMSQEGSISWLDADTGQPKAHFKVPGNGELSLAAVAPDGELRVVAGESGKLWARADGKDHWQGFSGGGQSLLRLLYLSPGVLLSAGYDGSLRAWDTGRAQEIAMLGGHDRYAWSLDLDADHQRLVSGGLDGLVRVWRVGSTVPAPGLSMTRLLCPIGLQVQPDEQLLTVANPRCD